MSRVVHFEVPADDVARAQAFYGKAFGWQFQAWDGPMDYTFAITGTEGRGIDGAIIPRQAPGTGTVNTIDVPSLDRAIQAVEKAGGRIAVPKMAIPGIGWLAYGLDTEGNMFGMMEGDEKAR